MENLKIERGGCQLSTDATPSDAVPFITEFKPTEREMVAAMVGELISAAVQSGYEKVGFGIRPGRFWFGLGGGPYEFEREWEFPFNDPDVVDALRSLIKRLPFYIGEVS